MTKNLLLALATLAASAVASHVHAHGDRRSWTNKPEGI